MSAFTGGLLVLHAETPLHPGAAGALGVVDLPVQRERHTKFPIIPGTSLKGVLRDAARRTVRKNGESAQDANADDLVVAIFGGAPGRDPEAGALSVCDARLLALPVRSLRGVFAWVTCAQVLERLARDAGLVGVESSTAGLVAREKQALVAPKSPLLADEKTVVLEEFDFEASAEPRLEAAAKTIAAGLLPAGQAFAATRARFERSLCVLSDDDFTYFARHSTEVVARIGLDPETKTATGGALFYQELLPSDCVFYAVVIAEEPRSKRAAGVESAAKLLDTLRNGFLPPYLQVGADETTGRGFCATRFVVAGGAR
jgi:CRISPR-associated protein Cmr4